MPLLHNSTLLIALTESASLILCLFLIPPIFFSFICISFSFFLILPILCLFALAFLFCKTVFGYPIRSLGMIFINFSVWVLDGTSMTVDESKIDKKVEGLKDEQVSLEWDPSEFPYHCESEEDEDEEKEKGEAGKHILCKNLDSWQIQLPESIKRGEHKSFYEVLTFWKRKEKVEV